GCPDGSAGRSVSLVEAPVEGSIANTAPGAGFNPNSLPLDAVADRGVKAAAIAIVVANTADIANQAFLATVSLPVRSSSGRQINRTKATMPRARRLLTPMPVLAVARISTERWMFVPRGGTYVRSHERNIDTRRVSDRHLRARFWPPRRVPRAVGPGAAAAAARAGGAVRTGRHRASIPRL